MIPTRCARYSLASLHCVVYGKVVQQHAAKRSHAALLLSNLNLTCRYTANSSKFKTTFTSTWDNRITRHQNSNRKQPTAPRGTLVPWMFAIDSRALLDRRLQDTRFCLSARFAYSVFPVPQIPLPQSWGEQQHQHVHNGCERVLLGSDEPWDNRAVRQQWILRHSTHQQPSSRCVRNSLFE